ncbi:MAG TPA: hypothetical protein GXX18_08635 [Bacillales bacterium]|nr:hypothetical protein [Bacillales bacterium]
MFDFMYFPDNKLEYIPAFIMVLICVLLTFLAIHQFIKFSKKEEEKARMLEKQLMENKLESHK